ncbi:MerR family transcriptional regulator [Nocardioides sp.]|uniref:MerR family transcriptional regulator n=1 Tax=Nocardioides sp. TaxID=35761 RepID=UPI00286A67A8|nr:MerR family transcriptional regulator [Nocardioides sp.]
MSAPAVDASADPSGDLLTIDELSAGVGLTVRTTRYYASLGLLPAPIRRGRVAYYDDVHRARLEMVRALQEHGFTLQAIEGFLAGVPADATVEDLVLQRAMLTSWTGRPPEQLSLRQLEKRAGRTLSGSDLRLLTNLGCIEEGSDAWVVMSHLEVGLGLLDLDIPEAGISRADEAIRRHMGALAEELTDILRDELLEPYRREPHSPEDAVRLEQTLPRLRQLTLEAVVAGFQRAANQVITRSLARD